MTTRTDGAAILSLWDDVECAGGSAQRGIPTPIEGTMTRRLDQSHELQIRVPRQAAWLSDATVRDVIRVETVWGGIFEWRIASVEDSVGDDNAVTVKGDPIHVDMTDVGFIKFEQIGGITEYNLGGVDEFVKVYIDTYVLPTLSDAGISWITRGTVDLNNQYSISWERWTPQRLMRRLQEETGLEYQLRRHGATDYKIDLVTEIGASLDTVLVSDQRNLRALIRERQREGLYTVIQPMGLKPASAEERAGIGFARWEVTGVSSNVLTLADRNGGAGPLIEDDQFVGKYVLKTDGTLTEITDSDFSAMTVTVSDASGISVGDDVEIRKDSSGTLLTELESPSGASAIGRVVGTYESGDRGEANYIPNPFATDWASKPDAIWGQVDGAHSSGSTSVALKNLPASYDLKNGDPLAIPNETHQNHIDADATTDGSGNVTVTLSGGSPTLAGDEYVAIHQIVGDEPDGWTFNQIGGDVNHAFGYYDPDETTDLTGKVDGAVSSDVRIDLDGLTSGDEIHYGDWLLSSTDALLGVVLNEETVDGTGAATVVIDRAVAVSDNDDITVARPGAFANRTFTNLAMLPPADVVGPVQLETPSITVKQVEGIDTIWVSAGLTVAAAEAITVDTTSSNYTGPELILRDTSGGTDLTSVKWDGGDLAAQSEHNVILRASYSMTGDATVAARINGLESATNIAATPPASAPTFVRWVMVHVGVEGSAPPVWGSHATQLWQDGNRRLDERKGWPTTYEVSAREMTELWDVDPAEEAMQLGGSIRLFSPEIDLDQTIRIKEITYDLTDAQNTQIVLDTARSRLSTQVRQAKPVSLFVDVDTTVTADDEVQQTVTTSEDPPTKEGTRRTIGDPDTTEGDNPPALVPPGGVG